MKNWFLGVSFGLLLMGCGESRQETVEDDHTMEKMHDGRMMEEDMPHEQGEVQDSARHEMDTREDMPDQDQAVDLGQAGKTT